MIHCAAVAIGRVFVDVGNAAAGGLLTAMMGWPMGRDVASIIHVDGFEIPQDGAYAAASVEGVGIVFAATEVAKAGSLVRVANGTRSLDDLSRAASVLDRGGLTLAGRALQKHGSRRGSAFPTARGNPSAINQQGQNIVDDILTAPGSTTASRHHARFGNVTEIRAPDGRGIRYGENGEFLGFLEPRI